jgi:hypothetical protein
MPPVGVQRRPIVLVGNIINGTPLIRVEIYRGGGGPFIVVTLIN